MSLAFVSKKRPFSDMQNIDKLESSMSVRETVVFRTLEKGNHIQHKSPRKQEKGYAPSVIRLSAFSSTRSSQMTSASSSLALADSTVKLR